VIGPNAIVGEEMPATAVERKPWHASFRLLERDERVFAVLLAVVMVGGLTALGLFPLRPRYRDLDLKWLVVCFAAYKVGIFALVTVNPRATRAYFIGALGIDLLLVFVLLCLTGAGDSVFYLLFFPLVAVNAYYFGPWVGLGASVVAGGLYAWSTVLVPPWVGWTPHVILAALAGLPAVTLGLVADRERRARGEVERLNDELTGTLSRLQTAQQELVVAERMATVGRLSLRIAHEVRNPISAIELNAEMLEDIVRGRSAAEMRERSEAEMKEALALVAAIRDQVTTLDALTEEYLAFARFPRPHFEEESVNHLVQELADFIRPVATRQGLTVRVEVDPKVPVMEIDRGLLRQAVLNLVKNGLESLSRGGELTIESRFDGDAVEIAVCDTGAGIPVDVGPRLFEQFFTTKPQGTGLGLSITRQIAEEHDGEVRWANRRDHGATFTIRLPIKRVTNG
jgi:signal transduction histidine kinase